MLEQRISQDDKEVLIDMIREVSELFEKSNVTYIMYSGTLLGSYRHHALIPWDDDVDFQISINDKPKVVQALANLNKEYIFVQKYNLIWKIFNEYRRTPKAQRRHRTQYRRQRILYPQIDLFFFSENSTHAEGIGPDGFPWPKSDVFPIVRRHFEGFLLPAPRNTKAHLERIFPHFEECCVYLDPWTMKYQNRSGCAVKCSLLHSKWPFHNDT